MQCEVWLFYQKNKIKHNKAKTNPNPTSKANMFPSISEKSHEVKCWIILSYFKKCGGKFCRKGEREEHILNIFLAGKGRFSVSEQESFKYRSP